MKKRTVSYLIDMGMAVSFAVVLVSGLFSYGGLVQVLARGGVLVPAALVIEAHRISGLAMTGLVFAHIVLHWKWMMQTSAQALRRVFQRVVRRNGGSRTGSPAGLGPDE